MNHSPVPVSKDQIHSMADQCVVFDIGNVLVDWDPRHLYRAFFPGRPEAMEWFLENVCSQAWNLEQDGGRSWEEAFRILIARYPEWRAEINAFDRRWHEMIPSVIEGTVAVLDDLHRSGVPLYAITNFSSEKFRECRDRFPFFGQFRGIVVSGDERVLKPHGPIFALLLQRYGLVASNCVFIDDNSANVAGAEAAGMRAIQFTTPEKLRASLRDHGFAI